MASVVVKPRRQIIAKPTVPFPKKTMKPSLRQATALVAAAAANGVVMDEACVVPRELVVEGAPWAFLH